MHVTAMHFAFLTSKSVTKDTKLGRVVLETAQRHHNRIVRQQQEIALKKIRAQEEKKLAAEKMLIGEAPGVASLEM